MNKTKLLRQFCTSNIALLNKLIPQTADASAAAELKTQLASIERLQTSIGADVAAGADADDGLLEKAFDLLEQSRNAATALAARLETTVQQVAGFEGRVKSGDLLTKEIATEMCTAAGKTATEAAEKKAREEFSAKEAAAKRVTERRAALQTASLPLPETDELLGTDDAVFAAARTEAEKRLTPYKDKIPVSSKVLARYAWCSATDLPNWEGIVKEIAGAGAGRIEPMAVPGATGKAVVALCAV